MARYAERTSVSVEKSRNEIESTLAARFWAKVDTSGACWLWTGASSRGRGQIGVQGKVASAPRVAWYLHQGEWPDLDVCHYCDEPLCVRFEHLFLGSHRDNMLDAALKGRTARGTSHAHAVLTEDDVRMMRRRYEVGDCTVTSLARDFGVGRTTAWKVLNGVTWGWL